MDIFFTYWKLGIQHITDFTAYDHLLFLWMLCVSYTSWREWRRLIVLVTAFTLGHAFTLILATIDGLRIDSFLVEAAIPLTIIATSLMNLFGIWQKTDQCSVGGFYGQYVVAFGFGLIHGLGFSSYLRSLLMGMQSIYLPLFAFNIGVEMGQLLIVAALILITALLKRLGLSLRVWIIVSSIIGILLALHLLGFV